VPGQPPAIERRRGGGQPQDLDPALPALSIARRDPSLVRSSAAADRGTADDRLSDDALRLTR
jgi:hypothetical protein